MVVVWLQTVLALAPYWSWAQVPMTCIPPAEYGGGAGKWVQTPDLLSSSDDSAKVPGSMSLWDGPERLLSPSRSSCYDTLVQTAGKSLSEVLYSPQQVAEGWSKMTYP